MKQLIPLLLVAQAAIADEDAVTKYKNFLPQEIFVLPEKVRSAEVPMMYLFAARTALGKGSDLLFAMYLNSLMYPGLADYGNAIRQFQTDLGDKPTGTLTVWEIHNLEKRAELQKLSEIQLLNSFFGYIDESIATVEGTFVIIDDKIAYPVNHTTVNCDRKQGECYVDQMYVQLPDDNGWGGSNYYFSKFDRVYYKITNWTKESIDATFVPILNDKPCRSTALNFNFATKEFYEIARNTGTDCKVLDTVMPKLEKPRVSQIVDGKEVIAGEFAKRKKAAYDVLASSFRAKADILTAEAPNASVSRDQSPK